MRTLGIIVLLVAGIAVTAGAGLYVATLQDDPLETPVSLAGNKSEVFLPITHQGAELREGIVRLKSLGLVAEAPQQTASEPPPAINISEELRRTVSAVTRDKNGFVVVLVDSTAPSARTRRGKGDAFQDGWRFAQISQKELVLRRGDEEIRLPVMALELPVGNQAEQAEPPESLPPG